MIKSFQMATTFMQRALIRERAANVPVCQRQQPFRELFRKRRIEKARAIAEPHPHAGCQMQDSSTPAASAVAPAGSRTGRRGGRSRALIRSAS